MTATGFVRAFALQHKTRQNRPFCWILGAGASVSSGIPTANDLARVFLRELCIEENGSDKNMADWLAIGGPGIPGLDPANPARHYPEIYHARFGDCPDAGYAFLEEVMHDKTPSYGYAVLAWLLAETPHRIVITTNFDNLVADSLASHTRTFPRVVGHVQLTEFVQTELRRPLIAKIHGDLGFRPLNTSDEIAKLDARWQCVLEQVFQRCTPIVIGYGGNDKTLMAMLCALPPGTPDRVYWCQRESQPLSDEVREFLASRSGARLVRHPGFDELMLLLEDHLRTEKVMSIPNLEAELAARQKQRLAVFSQQRAALGETLAKATQSGSASQPSTNSTGDERRALTGAASRVLANKQKGKPWWKWVLDANEETDISKKDAIYAKALRLFPTSAGLLGNYANFLCDERRDLDQAEAFFKRAIEADPTNPIHLGNYANFLRAKRRDFDQAEAFYKRAIEADPQNANILGNHATFLRTERRDLDQAEAFFKRAIEADPKHANNLGNYATFLRTERRDLDQAEVFYKRAIEADPKFAIHLGNYATFLREERRDPDQAEIFYKRAIEADPKNAIHLGNYANFLSSERRDLDQAEAFYKRAIEADPKYAIHLGNYAIFLRKERHDLDQAEAFYKRAIEADPKYAIHLGNYAAFLRKERHDLDQAEIFYKRAIEADPKNAILLGNYAYFLSSERRDLDQAEAFYKRAIEADPKYAIHLSNYATFLREERHDLDQAEAFYKRAIEADPKNAIHLGNYANFLLEERHDLDQAEAFYKRAIEADPKNAIILGNYANFLREERHDLDQAEAFYKRAIEADPKNAITLGSYANFLRNERHDLDQAEAFYKRAIEADPKNAITLGNYAQMLFARGRKDEAWSLLDRAESLRKTNEEELCVELAYYRAAHDPKSLTASLHALRSLLERGVRSPKWQLAPNIERAQLDGHPNVPLLRVLAAVISDGAPLASLEEFPEWQAAAGK
jgi:Tfp pilus assembly protein PilF